MLPQNRKCQLSLKWTDESKIRRIKTARVDGVLRRKKSATPGRRGHDVHHNDTQHDDVQNKGPQYEIQYYDTNYNDMQHIELSITTFSIVKLSTTTFSLVKHSITIA
jgi:hypothetical protein